MKAAAVEASSQKPGARLIFVRVLCLLSPLVISPLVIAPVLTLFLVVFGVIKSEWGSIVVTMMFGIFSALFIAGPIVLGVVILMLPFLRRPRLGLGLVVATTALSTIAYALPLNGEFENMPSPGGMARLLVFALTSAAICWRLTKRWHSPE